MEKLYINLFMNLSLVILPAMNYIHYGSGDACNCPCYLVPCCAEVNIYISYKYTLHVRDTRRCVRSYIKPSNNRRQTRCVKSTNGDDIVDGDRGAFTFDENNTSTLCKSYCKSERYRFAGTKDILCMCAESIQNDVKSAICDYKCSADEKEVCGGKEGISLFYTGYQNTRTTEQELTTTTTTITTTTETTEIVTPTKSRTELSSTKNQIRTESQVSVTTESRTELSSIKNQIRTESQVSLTTEAAQGSSSERISSDKEQREYISTVTVVCMAVPSVIIVVTLFICLILRRRRLKCECSVNYYTNGSDHNCHASESVTGNNFEHGNLRGTHNDNKSSTSQHIEENAYSSADCCTEYSAVSSADSPQAAHTYGCLKAQFGMNPTKYSEYSHMTVSKANPKFTDNTYAHIRNNSSLEISTGSHPETDSTYNTLQASSAKHVADKISKSESDQYPLYDHATAGIGNKKRNNADEYAHLNSVKAKVTTSKGNNTINYVCEAIEKQETVVYEEATHDYFILEPKK